MEDFKVDDIVRVRPQCQTAIHKSTTPGRIAEIKPLSRYPIGVQFLTHFALFTPDELEKI